MSSFYTICTASEEKRKFFSGLDEISGFLSDNELIKDIGEYRYWRKSLAFCIECLKDGYHSTLHQFVLIHKCPFHQTPLYKSCPGCREQIPYELTDRFFESPYNCVCSYNFRETQSILSFSSHWGLYTPIDIQDKNVQRWISLDSKEKEKMNRIYLYPHIELEQTPQLMSFLYSALEGNEHEIDQYQFSVVKSPSNVQHLKKSIPDMKTSLRNWTNINTGLSLEMKYDFRKVTIAEELLKVRNQTILAIGKHLKKTILKEHKTCIKRYVNTYKKLGAPDSPICPYAYAYVKWKQSLFKINHFYDVDNRPLPSMSYSQSISVIYDRDWDPIHQLIDICLRNFPIQKPECYSHLKWVLSHLTGYLAMHYYFACLHNTSSQNGEKLYEKELLRIKGNVFAFLFPQGEKEPFRVFWDRNFHENTYQIVCPFPNKKAKKIKAGEVSHHPIRMAINKSGREEVPLWTISGG
ncbi:hypothetical protein [Paenibacillus sp. ISL-20]|uniref:hypothetical protein n=1 Tax=Paenibacillus sp. ISL-20 TaxID=2819163 RepID=UPI001BE9BFBD|nr:hypothetical protein [Paenibacillus sp. ISL-20]MBT2766021.1 hypothetical protein [Paenibacillus sp. ISL-20]